MITGFILIAGIAIGLLGIRPQYRSLKIEMAYSPSVEDVCRIFFDTGKGFNESEMLKFSVYPGGGVRAYIIVLPAGPLKKLRIDPGYKSDEFGMKSITLSAGAKSIHIGGKRIPDFFKVAEAQADYPGDEKGIMVLRKGTGPSPRLVFKKDVSHVFSLANPQKEWFLRLSVWLLTALAAAAVMALSPKNLPGVRHRARIAIEKIEGMKGEGLMHFFRQNKALILFTFAISWLVYGFELFGFSLSIDEELTSFGSAPELDVYLRVGRWGIYLLNYIIYPHSILPYYPFFIAISAIAVCSVLFTGTRATSTSSKLVFAIVFVTHPLHAHYLTFNTSNLYYGIGMALTAFSFLLFEKSFSKGKWPLMPYILLSVIILAFSVSLYQAMIPFFLVFASFWVIWRILEGYDTNLLSSLRTILWILTVVIISIGLYKVLDMIIRQIVLGSGPENQLEYIDHMILWGVLPFKDILWDLFQSTGDYLTGSRKDLNYTGWSIKAFLPLLAALVIVLYTKKRPFIQRVLLLAGLMMLVLSPFSLNIANGKSMPVRTLMAFPLMMAMVWMLLVHQAPVILKRVVTILAFVLLISHFYWNTRLFYASHASWQADRVMAARIAERIMLLDLPGKYTKPKVAFVGHYALQQNTLFIKSEVLGASFFEWDNGNPPRIKGLFRTMGIEEMELVSPQELMKIKNQIAEMPSWPRKGSVALIGDIVVVKLSEDKKK
jgi:hypothetical protein